jgi:hypothetical protein
MNRLVLLCVLLVLLALTMHTDMVVAAKGKGKGGKGKGKGKGKAKTNEVSVDGTSSETAEPVHPDTKPDAAADKAEEPKPKKGSQSRFNKDYKMEKLEKSWERGDSQDELEHEFEINRRVGQRVQSKKLDMSDPKAIADMFKKNPLESVGLGGGTTVELYSIMSLKLMTWLRAFRWRPSHDVCGHQAHAGQRRAVDPEGD